MTGKDRKAPVEHSQLTSSIQYNKYFDRSARIKQRLNLLKLEKSTVLCGRLFHFHVLTTRRQKE